MKRSVRLTALLLAAMLLFGCARPRDAAVTQTVNGLRTLLNTKNVPESEDVLSGAGSSVSDWLVFTLARCGETGGTDTYLSALEAAVTGRYKADGCLDGRRATEYQRIALTALALGADPRAFGKDETGAPADLVAGGIWAFPGGDVGAQGVNAVIFALLLLDAGGYTPPENAAEIRERLLSSLLSLQHADGAWGLTDDAADADLTAMAVQALAPYKETEAKTAIEKALAWLSSQQTSDGGFSVNGEVSAETASQVILACCALGTDPDTSALGFSGGLTAALERFRTPDGSFKHVLTEENGNLLATQQALLAICAVERLRAGEPFVYDFHNEQRDL